jgi:tetratricopeptide (TPR) repeat protein
VLAPDAISDFSMPVSAAGRAVQSDAESISCLDTLSAVLYRAGQFEKAIQRLTEADQLVEEPNPSLKSSPAYTWYFLAMAHHKLGHDAEAKDWLDRANEWTDKLLREHEEGTTTLTWNRRLTLKLLREEAVELMIEE